MKTITGNVTKVSKIAGLVESDFGSFERINITINDGASDTTVQKLVKPGTDNSFLVGKRVKADYTEKEFNGKNGKFTSRSVKSKDFAILDVEKPSVSAASTTNSYNTSEKSYKGGQVFNNSSTKSSYNSDGARHGMIVNNSIVLANNLGDSSLKGLKISAAIVLELTQFVEGGCKQEDLFTKPKASSKKKEVSLPDSDQEDPFS